MKPKTFDRYISAKERDAVPDEDFAGPHQSFPIRNQHDVDSAARLIGHADNPDAVKAKIIEIAKRKGLSIPDAWQDKKDGSEERMAGATDQPTSISFFAPFVRLGDKQSDKREVVGKATRGTPIDTYGTVITYDGSKKAFARAQRIPLREMHQPKAVGKGLEWWGDDNNEDLYLHSYISRGAEDTWTKVQEDVLVGYSIKGANARYGTIVRDGKTIPAIVDYDLVEVSLVDNPSCPGCDVAILRGDGIEQVIASDEEMAEVLKKEQQAVAHHATASFERAGASISAANRDKLHATRDSLMSMCADSGCTDCAAKMQYPDDPDGDNDAEKLVERMMGPVYARMQAFLGEFARRAEDTSRVQGMLSEIQETIKAVANVSEMAATLKEMQSTIQRIADTPMPGGPHTGRMATKHLATDGEPSNVSDGESVEMIGTLSKMGVALTPQQQTRIVAASLKRM